MGGSEAHLNFEKKELARRKMLKMIQDWGGWLPISEKLKTDVNQAILGRLDVSSIIHTGKEEKMSGGIYCICRVAGRKLWDLMSGGVSFLCE